MRVRFWGTRGSIPVGLTVADVRDKLAAALLAASGRRFASFAEAHAFASRDLPFSLSHTYGGHTSCVELDAGGDEYFVCDMGSGARPFGEQVDCQLTHRRGMAEHDGIQLDDGANGLPRAHLVDSAPPVALGMGDDRYHPRGPET